MKKEIHKKIVVIYHASCPDGFAAAWVARKKFGARAEYRPVSHGQPPLDLRGSQVYFLDLVYGPEDMRRAIKTAASVVVIDHHVSAEESVKMAGEYLYNIKHSAAVLTWKYFYPAAPVPRLLRHIEDEDIWTFKLANTAAVNARLELFDFDFAAWDKAIRAFEKPAFRAQFIREGKLIADYHTRMVHRFIKENAVPVRFLKYRIFAVNAMRPFTSELGHELCKMKPPLAIVWHEDRNNISVSMRSDGSVDVSKIAARFGGGGHKAAAAFRLPRGSAKPWKYEKDMSKEK